MALQTTAIATSIAAFSISGVTVTDLDDFKDEVSKRDVPYLMPAPDYFSAPAITRDSQGPGSVAKLTAKYILKYRFLYETIGSERKYANIFQGFVGKVALILDAIILNDSTADAIDLWAGDISAFGVVTDPAGNQFYGSDIAIVVTEYVN